MKSLSFSVLPSWILHGNAYFHPRQCCPVGGAQGTPLFQHSIPQPQALQIQLAFEVAFRAGPWRAWTQTCLPELETKSPLHKRYPFGQGRSVLAIESKLLVPQGGAILALARLVVFL